MRPSVIPRALSLVAVAATGWSLNVRWGADTAVRGGPPMQWERIVVGAALLAAVSALLVWLATRARASRPLAYAATAFALGPGALAVHLRQSAQRDEISQLLSGSGWTWLAAGAGAILAAAIMAIIVTGKAGDAKARRPAPRSAKGRSKR